jgi:hypothetical protein
VVRLPPQPWPSSSTGTRAFADEPPGWNAVQQISTGSLPPASGTLVMQPSVTVGAGAADDAGASRPAVRARAPVAA